METAVVAMRLAQFLREQHSLDWPAVTVQASSDTMLEVSLSLDSSLSYFRGHFPGKPVLPGIVQIHWVSTLASVLYSLTAKHYQLDNIKFLRMVLPPATLQLRLTLDRDKQAVSFTYMQQGERVSTGKVLFL
jgi:3-hydroxymyristoyl/3-hydroxydecanoyl-(acyl carrier protein) dehydratase